MWITSTNQRAAMPDHDQMFPPITPDDDEDVLPADPSFASECMSAIAADAEQFEWRFNNAILTRSKRWGLVWRVDFTTQRASANTAFINRVTCWRLDEAAGDDIGIYIAFGQRVKRL
jgi:hypothetical protein